MNAVSAQVNRRRTFAIISHPDAGKTTLTEKLLLFGGAIQLAGAVKARGDQRRAHSDWMKVERERGISVTASVMTFNFDNKTFNLLDTPGHEDFSEDTYRVLTAVDSAVMVIDAARGIQEQTRKLFEVCRLRDMPITTFINKMDREAQDPFDLMDEIEQNLQIEVTPASWPIGMGSSFLGCYDIINDQLILMDKARRGEKPYQIETCEGLEDQKLDALLPEYSLKILRQEIELVKGLCPEFNRDAYLSGNLTPIFFGSAINSFGVSELISGLSKNAPPPRPQPAIERKVNPDDKKVSGFIFKIQANMDPRHRDRMAFLRLCSGHFKRGMKLKNIRNNKQISLHNAVLFLARDRELAEDAWAGDIIGIPNHGNLHIGDSLTEGEALHFSGLPSFAPEHFKAARPEDPMRAKHLSRALQQLAEEGAVAVFKPHIGSDWIVGAVGILQFEVMADRIRTEYEVPTLFEATSLITARWVETENATDLKNFIRKNEGAIAVDHRGDPVFLARNTWHLDRTQEDWPQIVFSKTKEQIR
ncbi:MAG: peptide chain release factor 3 [Rhodospirillaceae bacterium]|mgnify:CR=1 FL=1|nr:peptide chain release factor 3 [Rhodospirillaceae bacterium]